MSGFLRVCHKHRARCIYKVPLAALPPLHNKSNNLHLRASRQLTTGVQHRIRHISHLLQRAATMLEANTVSFAVPTTPQPSSSNADTAPVEEGPPPRVYDVYSWKVKSPNARLIYIRDLDIANVEIAKLRPGPFGFDLEWKPNYRKGEVPNPVALVQIGSADVILLIQVSAMIAFPENLREFLRDPQFVKTGVGIQQDCRKLYIDYAMNVRNCVDLSLLARSVDNARWKGKYTNPIGLARLCEAYEELTLNKGKVQRSNWEALLTPQQQDYAANDAHSAYTIYQHLCALHPTVSPTPLPHYYTFNTASGCAVDLDTMRPWNIANPHYDPGPPPPPRPPKPKPVPENGEMVMPVPANRRGRRERGLHQADAGPKRAAVLSPDAMAFVPVQTAQMHTQVERGRGGPRGLGGRGRGGGGWRDFARHEQV
ncbi:ribonuclease H-like domain-containing protein [Amylocystis lapponica]|nr:ribonuclease H-like domain-containing protein [Amylocystis lapponica]